MKALNTQVLEAPVAGIKRMTDIALTMPECIRLEIGDSDFDTPEHIREVGIRAIREGRETGRAETAFAAYAPVLMPTLVSSFSISSSV